MPIQPSEIPDWINWIAQDADGAWWGYSIEPLQHDTGWYENEIGDCLKLDHTAPNPAWRNSLRRYNRN